MLAAVAFRLPALAPCCHDGSGHALRRRLLRHRYWRRRQLSHRRPRRALRREHPIRAMPRWSVAEQPPPAPALWSDQIPFGSRPIDDTRIRLSSAGQPIGLWPDRRIAARARLTRAVHCMRPALQLTESVGSSKNPFMKSFRGGQLLGRSMPATRSTGDPPSLVFERPRSHKMSCHRGQDADGTVPLDSDHARRKRLCFSRHAAALMRQHGFDEGVAIGPDQWSSTSRHRCPEMRRLHRRSNLPFGIG